MSIKDEKNIKAFSNNYTTMTPGGFQKWLRTCIIFQAIRFVFLNIKILLVVAKGH